MAVFEKQYLFHDRNRSDSVADYDTFEFTVQNCKLYGWMLWPGAETSEKRPCVILIHGFPGSLRNDDLAYALCRAGCVCIVPYHRGAWGSEGKYLPSRCIEDAVCLAEYIRTDTFAEKYNIDTNAVFLCGHSMGGNTTLQAALRLPWLRGLILLAPFDPTRFVRNDNPELLEELLLQCSTLKSDGKDAIEADILAHIHDWAFDEAGVRLQNRHLLCCSGSRDSCAPPEQMTHPLEKAINLQITESIHRFIEYPEEHGLVGSRLKMIAAVGDFISDVLDSENNFVNSGEDR